MDGTPKVRWGARRRVAAVATSAVVAALVAGTFFGATADANPVTAGDPSGCTQSTSVIDTRGSGTGLIGVDPSSGAVSVLTCSTGASPSSSSSTDSSPTSYAAPVSDVQEPAASPASDTSSEATATATATATSTDTAAAVTDTTSNAATTAAAAATQATKLDHLSVVRSTETVYPAKDGYLDSVRFAIRALNTADKAVAVEGSAVLTKAGHAIRSWKLDGSKRVIDWNGRVGTRIETGWYTLTVAAWSPDGSHLTGSSRVKVKSKHLETRTMTLRARIDADSTSVDMPSRLVDAFALGPVSVRMRTVAKVTGPAKLIFSSADGSAAFPLRDGTHTTKRIVVSEGFYDVVITHDWAPGAAHLKAIVDTWTYSALV